MFKKFKNIKIGKKIILTFVFIAAATSIASIAGLIGLIHMNTEYSSALLNYGFSQGDVGKFNAEFDSSRAYTQDVLLSVDEKNMLIAADNFSKSNKLINQYLAAMRKTMVNEKEINCYNTIKEEYQKFVKIENQVVEMSKQYNKSGAYTLLRTEGAQSANKLEAAIDSLIKLKTDTGNQLSADLSSEETAVILFIAAVILLSLLISFLIAFRISRSISMPVEDMAKAAQQMAQGDLSVQVHVESSDEIGQLGRAFSETIETIKAYITDIKSNLLKVEQGDLTISSELTYKGDFIELQKSIYGIVNALNETIAQINMASEQVSDSSGRVSNDAQALARGASEQTNTIKEFSMTLKEISAHGKKNAEHAANASANIKQVRSGIEICNQHMNEMICAMSQINDSSKQIEKIIKAIEDIAFQTNILSLNAAVEAARAGEAGKGFAVVADEVRNLAQKSAEAVKDTTALIRNSLDQVESGSKIADETAKSLLNVVENTKAVTDTMEKIFQAARQQSDAISQALIQVEQISKVTQTNSATAKEDAGASEELSKQAKLLKSLVDQFQLKTTT